MKTKAMTQEEHNNCVVRNEIAIHNLQPYLKGLLARRLQQNPSLKFKVLDNGALKIYEARQDRDASKALGTSLGNALDAMKHVRVCHA